MKGFKANITIKQLLTLIKTVSIIIVLAILGYSGYFLYENFYQVMTESEEIIKLQKSISENNVDMEGFNEAAELLEERKKKKSVRGLNDPFDR